MPKRGAEGHTGPQLRCAAGEPGVAAQHGQADALLRVRLKHSAHHVLRLQ